MRSTSGLTRLTALPREARDSLFLLATLAWVIAPLGAYLPLWCLGLAVGVLLWRALLALRAAPLPKRRWLLLLLLLAVSATVLHYGTLVGRDAGVTLVVILLALKTLEMRTQRDAFVIFFLGFFTLLANFFFSQTLLVAAAMLLALLGLLTALVNAHTPLARPPLAQSAKTALRMALLGAPIMVVLFVLFPRIAPLWGVPSDNPTGRSGLSNEMTVGTIARLALDESVALRVKFDDGVIPTSDQLYWRGPVLGQFDGRSWRELTLLSSPLAAAPALSVSGAPLRYEVTLEPTERPWLVVLDAAPSAPELANHELRQTSELLWQSNRSLSSVVRYRAQSYSEFSYGQANGAPSLGSYRRLPADSNPRTQALALELRQRLSDSGQPVTAQTLAQAALARLQSGGYGYTLEPGLYGEHSADEFWFDRKVGFCEHIAQAFVVLMRAAGVPARIVTGYQGGSPNPVDGYWLVRQSDAHAWAEIWNAEARTWQRVDPTSAVAPARTGALTRLRPPPGLLTQALGGVAPNFIVQLRNVWEAVNNRWTQWVLNYSQSKQLDLLKNLGIQSPTWADLVYLLLGLLLVVSLVGGAWALWERARQDPWLALLAQTRQRLRRLGLTSDASTTPRQLAQRLQQLNTKANTNTNALYQSLLALEAQRYAPDHALKLKQLGAQIRQQINEQIREHKRSPMPLQT